MASLTIKVKTTISPEQFVAALTDFGPGRECIWGNSQPAHFMLHKLGTNWADVTEGSNIFGGIWERLHYDWSKPGIIELRTVDSNVWANGSNWRYVIEEGEGGNGSVILAKVSRYPRSKKGYLLLAFLGSVGRPLIVSGFRKSLQSIEKKVQGS